MPTSRDVLDFVFDAVNNVLNVKLAANSGVDIGDVDIVSMPINTTTSGVIDAAAETVTLTLPGGASAVGMQITGTWVGQLEFEGTIDGTNYTSIEASNGTATVNATAGNDIFVLPGGGYLKIRTRASAWTSGSATVTFIASVGTAANILTGAIPAGTNNIGGTTDAGIASTSVVTYTASADMSTAAAITAAPTGGQKIVVDDIIFSTDTAMSFEFEEETSGTVFAKVYVPANGTVCLTTRGKLKLATADKRLFGDASVSGNVAVTVIYHSEA